jgi:hypothetical protein
VTTAFDRTRAKFRRLLVKAVHQFLSLGRTSWDVACVYGSPDHEENSLVTAVALAETGALRVSLLAADPGRAARYLALVNRHDAPIEILRKASFQGLRRASTAGVLLYTHGLYGSPDLTRRKLVVNLWHGFGPKATHDSSFFDLMPCNTPVWAESAARILGSPTARLLRSGNPRQINLERPPSSAALAELGLDSSPYIVWMPTFRQSTGTWDFPWRTTPLSAAALPRDSVDSVTRMAQLAKAANVHLVVKPHPIDADVFERRGLRVIRTEEILRAGMTLYQFIGASAAMISDYSSVWVEYLGLDRPLLLFCPDIAEYSRGRGLNRPYLTDVAAGLIAHEPEDVAAFFDVVGRGSDWRPEARQSARKILGLEGLQASVAPLTSTVLEELDRRRTSAHGTGR